MSRKKGGFKYNIIAILYLSPTTTPISHFVTRVNLNTNRVNLNTNRVSIYHNSLEKVDINVS